MSAMPDHLTIRNARVPRALAADPTNFGGSADGDCLFGDLHLVDGRVVGFLPAGAPPIGDIHDLAGRIILPCLVETHCHLDKCHTVARMGAVGGDLHAAIAAQARDKIHWNADDIRRRAGRGLTELEHAGCAVVRTHIDWDPAQIAARQLPTAWSILGELANERRKNLSLQRCALIPAAVFAEPDDATWAVRRIAQESGAALGVFVFDQPKKRDWLRMAFELAATYGLALDFHVDEGLGEELDGLEVIADLALETRFALPIVCGHACSLANLTGERLVRVVDKVAAAGIGIVSLPTTNLYLQDRRNGTPQRRGITRVRELAAAGVPIAIGSDNVCDAFCPIGAHDPMAALATAALTAHLDPPYDRWLPAVTTNARQMLGFPPVTIDRASIAQLLVTDAVHTAELIAGAARRRLRQSDAGRQ